LITVAEPFLVERVLSAADYWDPPSDSEWLIELLPFVRSFLIRHGEHTIVFGEPSEEHFYSYVTYDYLDWDDVGHGEPADISVSSLCSKHHCRKWADVEAYMTARRLPVWWWGQPELMGPARARFDAYLSDAIRQYNVRTLS